MADTGYLFWLGTFIKTLCQFIKFIVWRWSFCIYCRSRSSSSRSPSGFFRSKFGRRKHSRRRTHCRSLQVSWCLSFNTISVCYLGNGLICLSTTFYLVFVKWLIIFDSIIFLIVCETVWAFGFHSLKKHNFFLWKMI